MIRKKHEETGPIIIDLTGPEGNAYVILGYATRFANQLKYTKEAKELLVSEMMSGDYENLIQVFDKHFGEYVILER